MSVPAAVVAQTWPIANGGMVALTVCHDKPNAEAIASLGPVVAAIEAYVAKWGQPSR